MKIRLYPGGHNYNVDGSYLEIGDITVSQLEQLLNGSVYFCDFLNLNSVSSFITAVKSNYNLFLNNNCNNDYTPNGWSRSVRPVVGVLLGASEVSSFNALVLNNSINLTVDLNLYHPNPTTVNIIKYDVNFVAINNNQGGKFEMPGNNIYVCNQGINTSNLTYGSCSQNLDFHIVNQNACQDLRSSASNGQSVHIIVNGVNISQPVNWSYDHSFVYPTSGGINDSIDLTSQNVVFTSINTADCYLNLTDVCDDGVVKLYGQVEGDGIGSSLEVSRVNQEVLICQFGIPACCDEWDTCSETLSDTLNDLIGGYDSFNGTITLKRLEVLGFGKVTNFCCDDSDCREYTGSYPFESNSTITNSGGGGGDDGGDTDITCICDNLQLINGTLSTLNSKIDSLISAVSGLSITVNTSGIESKLDSLKDSVDALDCICDNLESIDTTIGNKDLSVTNTFSPSVPVPSVTNTFSPTVPVPSVTNNFSPVNNIPVPSVSVNADLSTINSNITALSNLSNLSALQDLGQISNQIAGGTVTLGDDLDDINTTLGLLKSSVEDNTMSIDLSALECNGVSIACILDSINDKLSYSESDSDEEKSITQVIAEKEIDFDSPVTEVIIEDGMFADVTRKVYEKKIASD